jgi:hypothetical protein
MHKALLFSVALVSVLGFGAQNGARAAPADPHLVGAIASSPSNVHLARAAVRGPRGGGAVDGPRGMAVRGSRGGAAVVGPRGRAAVVGPRGGAAVVGRPYYGGVWYGTGRRYWNGRWWPYGVGACWRRSPIGFVWVCG